MRIIFVGMHNKPDMTPLCSSTKSGKLVNRIAEGFKTKDVVKTNLYDVDYYPKPDEKFNLSIDWCARILPHENDVIVLLGAEVHENFKYQSKQVIKIAHPASQWSHEQMDAYVLSAREKIKKYYR